MVLLGLITYPCVVLTTHNTTHNTAQPERISTRDLHPQ